MEEQKEKKPNIISRLKSHLKPDPVMIAAWVLALVSAFFVHPDKEYFGYIDWRSLGILWALMVVIQGFRDNTVFEKIGEFLMQKVKYGWQLAAVLIFLCFFASMLITNDVALITFVPFAILILQSANREDLLLPVVVLQTIAANLGSSFTPIGNPQNLYLYGLTGMPLFRFLFTMLPYTLIALILLIVSLFFLPGKRTKITMHKDYSVVKGFGSKVQIIVFAVLFLLAIASVMRLVPYYIVVAVILIASAILNYRVLFRVDYILLLTFIGFFVFTGNIARIPQIKSILETMINGREFVVSVLVSQIISNVPATLLLSDFTTDYKNLLQGVNIGGLGTLIASMASLISYKSLSNSEPKKKGRYILLFTLVNLIYLAILIGFHFVLSRPEL